MDLIEDSLGPETFESGEYLITKHGDIFPCATVIEKREEKIVTVGHYIL
jgi:hypothetical protein